MMQQHVVLSQSHLSWGCTLWHHAAHPGPHDHSEASHRPVMTAMMTAMMTAVQGRGHWVLRRHQQRGDFSTKMGHEKGHQLRNAAADQTCPSHLEEQSAAGGAECCPQLQQARLRVHITNIRAYILTAEAADTSIKQLAIQCTDMRQRGLHLYLQGRG